MGKSCGAVRPRADRLSYSSLRGRPCGREAERRLNARPLLGRQLDAHRQRALVDPADDRIHAVEHELGGGSPSRDSVLARLVASQRLTLL